MQWMNEPPSWSARGEGMTMTVGARTDFWRKTHDGGVRHSGHFYHQEVAGDFAMSVKVTGAYADLYDQAGLMIQADERVWMKCGIEYLHGVQQASVVITHEWSDWSVLPLENPRSIWLRVLRHGATIEVHYSLDDYAYTMIRQAYLSEKPTLSAGMMAAAPTGPGFEVNFDGFKIES